MIDVREFRAAKPGLHPYNLHDSYATRAKNLWLSSGEFEPVRENLALTYSFIARPAGLTSIQRVRRNDGSYNYLQIPDLSLAQSVTENDQLERVYFGQLSGGLILSVNGDYTDDITYTTRQMGLIEPFSAVTTVTGVLPRGTGEDDTTLYVTYLTAQGEESAPTRGSIVFGYNYGDSIGLTVTGPVNANIEAATYRVYMEVESEVRLISEVAAGTVTVAGNDVTLPNFTISPNNTTILSATFDSFAPPIILTNIINASNGMLAGVGYQNRTLLLSEPGNPISYTRKIPFDRNIVRIIRAGEDVLVLTDERPSVVVGDTPETAREQMLPFSEPCVSRFSVVDMGFAILYVSYSGICAISQYQGEVLTQDNRFDGSDEVISTEQWQALPVNTIRAGAYQGRYVFYYQTAPTTWEGKAFNIKYKELTDLETITADEIYFVKNPDVNTGEESMEIFTRSGIAMSHFRFAAGPNYTAGEWERRYEIPFAEPYVYARVVADNYINCTLKIDTMAPIPVTSKQHFAIPSTNRNRDMTALLTNGDKIQSFRISHNISDLY